MVALLCFFLTLFYSPFRSKSRLEAENAALRHQLTVLRRKLRGRVQLTNDDRLFLIQLYRSGGQPPSNNEPVRYEIARCACRLAKRRLAKDDLGCVSDALACEPAGHNAICVLATKYGEVATSRHPGLTSNADRESMGYAAISADHLEVPWSYSRPSGR